MKAEAELQRKLQEEESKKPKFERPPSYTHERKHPLPSNNALLYGKVTATSRKLPPNLPSPPKKNGLLDHFFRHRRAHFPQLFEIFSSYWNERWESKLSAELAYLPLAS